MSSVSAYNVQVPYLGVIEHGFHPGKLVKIQGTVLPSANRFAINLLCGPNSASGDDIALHLNPRFDNNCIVRNSLQQMNWQQEEAHGHMPLVRGQGFEILILCDPNHYKIAVNGQHFAEFSHRLPCQRVSHLSIEGDVTIATIFYEGGQSIGTNHPSAMGVMPGFSPPQHIAGGSPMPHHATGGNLYPTVPVIASAGSMPYPSQPGGYGHAPMPGQPIYSQGYQQPPYSGYGQAPGYPHSPGQYPPPPPPGYPQGYQQYPSTPSQGTGGFLDKAGAAITGAMGSAALMSALGGLTSAGSNSSQPSSNRGGLGGLFDQAGAALTGALGSSGLMGPTGGAHPPNPPPMPPTTYAPNNGGGSFSGLSNLGLQNMLPKSFDDLKNLVQTRRY